MEGVEEGKGGGRGTATTAAVSRPLSRSLKFSATIQVPSALAFKQFFFYDLLRVTVNTAMRDSSRGERVNCVGPGFSEFERARVRSGVMLCVCACVRACVCLMCP